MAFLCQGKTSPIDWKKDSFYFRLLRWRFAKDLVTLTLAFRRWFQTIKCLLQTYIEVIRLLPLNPSRRSVRRVRTLEIYWVPLILAQSSRRAQSLLWLSPVSVPLGYLKYSIESISFIYYRLYIRYAQSILWPDCGLRLCRHNLRYAKNLLIS